MLERNKLRNMAYNILTAKMPTDVKVYNSSDIDFSAQEEPTAINIKVLQQSGNNATIFAKDPRIEGSITLQVIIFCAQEKVDNWADVLDELCEKVQWALMWDKEFHGFGALESFNTTIDDGTGDQSEVRVGGALLEFKIKVTETPDAPYGPDKLDEFRTMHTEIVLKKDSPRVHQTTKIPQK